MSIRDILRPGRKPANPVIVRGRASAPAPRMEEPKKDDEKEDKDKSGMQDNDGDEGKECPECGAEMTPDEDGVYQCGGCGHRMEDDQHVDDEDEKSAPSSSVTNGRSKGKMMAKATLKELRASQFGKDDAFVLDCLERDMTMEQANSEYITKLQADLVKANGKNKALLSLGDEGKNGADPVSATRGASASSGDDPGGELRYEDHVEKFMKSGLSNFKAHREATIQYPKLKMDWHRRCAEIVKDNADKRAQRAV